MKRTYLYLTTSTRVCSNPRCGKEFTFILRCSNRERKFCSPKCAHNHHYHTKRKLKAANCNKVKMCYYCTTREATTKDHVIPYLYAGKVPNRTGGHIGNYPGKTVDACSLCNSILGSKIFKTLAERVDYVRARLYLRLIKVRRKTNSLRGTRPCALATHPNQ